jgi:CheY-like chemotaxis protein
MPVMNGFEAARKIRRFEREHRNANKSSTLPWDPTTIAALTALDNVDARKEAFASGMDEFLAKPVNRQYLRTLLQRAGKGR